MNSPRFHTCENFTRKLWISTLLNTMNSWTKFLAFTLLRISKRLSQFCLNTSTSTSKWLSICTHKIEFWTKNQWESFWRCLTCWTLKPKNTFSGNIQKSEEHQDTDYPSKSAEETSYRNLTIKSCQRLQSNWKAGFKLLSWMNRATMLVDWPDNGWCVCQEKSSDLTTLCLSLRPQATLTSPIQNHSSTRTTCNISSLSVDLWERLSPKTSW
jgi:hypothetical protein